MKLVLLTVIAFNFVGGIYAFSQSLPPPPSCSPCTLSPQFLDEVAGSNINYPPNPSQCVRTGPFACSINVNGVIEDGDRYSYYDPYQTCVQFLDHYMGNCTSSCPNGPTCPPGGDYYITGRVGDCQTEYVPDQIMNYQYGQCRPVDWV